VKCVVCGAAIADDKAAVFANPYERIRGFYACCSAACSERFDPDRHWIPARAPAPVSGSEETRLARAMAERLAYGDQPIIVIREMLVAGLSPHGLRRKLAGELAASQRRRAGPSSWWLALLGIRRRRDRRDPKALAAAAAAIDEWPYPA